MTISGPPQPWGPSWAYIGGGISQAVDINIKTGTKKRPVALLEFEKRCRVGPQSN